MERLQKSITFIKKPQFLIILITLLLLWKVLAMGQIVYGDIPYFDVAISKVNFLYSWGPEQLGTSVRQGLNTFRDEILANVSFTNTMFYFLKYIAPLILIPVSYFFIFKKLRITNQFALIVASIFPLCTPIVFGDFISGQTFWIYLTIPWVLYFAIRIFCLHEFNLRNYLLLSLMLFLSLGMLPPIILPLLATLSIFIFLAFLFSAYSPGKTKLMHRYIIAGAITLVTFGLMAAPYLLVASSGQQAYTPASLLGDYYHNYSATYYLNIFRLAGNNGNGQSTLGYNDFSPINILGYAIFILTIAGAVIISIRRRHDHRLATLCLLATLLIILFFMDFLATSMDIGAMIFQSQWVVSTIRNPSKLFTIIMPIFTLLLAFCLQNLTEYLGKGWQRVAVGVGMIAVIGLYGWPVWRGDLGLLYGREDQLALYKKDPVVQEIAAEAPKDSRSLLLPAHHRDELNYQNINPGLNILRLEGGMPRSSEMVKNLNTTLNARDQYFFNYLTTTGTQDVFIKKDNSSYQDALFTLFPVRITPDQAQQFVRDKLPLQNETNDYWHFKKEIANPLVFSPQTLTNVKGDQSLKTITPFLADKAGVVNDPDPAFAEFVTTYEPKTNLEQGYRLKEGRAQLHDSSLLIADLYMETDKDSTYAVIDILKPLDYSVQESHRLPLTANAHAIFIGDQHYNVSAQKSRIVLRAGDYEVQSATLTPVDIAANDPSFENTTSPEIHDATPQQKGEPGIFSERSDQAVDGKQALLLGSSNHTAFAQKELSLPATNDSYLLSYQYKNIEGRLPSSAILQGDTSLDFKSSQTENSNGWRTYETYFWPETNKNKRIELFLYTAGKPQQKSQNLFDDIRLYKVELSKSGDLALTNYQSDYKLTNYTHSQRQEINSVNLLDNPSFEEDGWGEVGDATAGASGEAKIAAEQSSDAFEGQSSLKLSSSNHTAFVAKTIKQFEPNRVYKLGFYYKNLSGHTPTFAVWQEESNIARPSHQLPGKPGEWQYYETYFVPQKDATNLTIYLYSPSSGENTVNLFDNVTITPASLVATYLERTTTNTQTPDDIVIDWQRNAPTILTVRAKPGKGLLVFNESFHAGWRAYAVKQPQKTLTFKETLLHKPQGQEITNHIVVNNFANGWWVDSSAFDIDGEYSIILVYAPQKNIFLGFLSTTGTITVIGGYLIFQRRRQKIT